MRFDVLTIFPEILDSYINESLFKRAKKEGFIEINTVNIRSFSKDRHKKVDDKPFGGGPGMVMSVDPIYRAVKSVIKKPSKSVRTILFSPRGNRLDSKMAQRLAGYKKLVLICGRYEGIDERVADNVADEVVSIGDYVLSGGELPAMVLIEAVSRFIPGFLGKYESLEDINGSHPAYTRPEIYRPNKKTKWSVPEVLLSGDHKKIQEWRSQK